MSVQYVRGGRWQLYKENLCYSCYERALSLRPWGYTTMVLVLTEDFVQAALQQFGKVRACALLPY